jgi:hypothetical protein
MTRSQTQSTRFRKHAVVATVEAKKTGSKLNGDFDSRVEKVMPRELCWTPVGGSNTMLCRYSRRSQNRADLSWKWHLASIHCFEQLTDYRTVAVETTFLRPIHVVSGKAEAVITDRSGLVGP